MGIKVDEDGSLLEAAIANIGIVLKNGEFITPPPDKIIDGTTLKKCLSLFQSQLIPQGLVKSVKFDYFNEEFLIEHASEAILFGGDKVIPIL